MKRIQTKITLTYVFVILLAVSASAVMASIGTQSYLTGQRVDELAQRIDVLTSLMARPADDSLSALYDDIHRLALAMDVRITLIDSAGVVLADSDVPQGDLSHVGNHLQRPEIQQALREGTGSSSRLSATVNKEFLYVARVVRLEGSSGMPARVKFMRLSAHLEEIHALAGEVRRSILIAGAVVLVVVAGVSLLLSRRIATPMERIAEAVDRIRGGNLETRIEVAGGDEVGRVAQAVNEMVAKLKADIVELRKLERVRSEFLGNVSHELRTPIFSLQGFLETLLDGAVDDPAVNRAFLQKAFNHSVRLNTLLGDLITISHIESGEMKMSFRYFDLKELLSVVVEEFRPTADLNKVTLRLDESSPSGVEVLGDKERLRVVFENLLENAIKYNKPAGSVTVSYRKAGEEVVVRVSDTGVGIAPEHHPRIFERFYRVDKNRSREVGGTGLGLAIVKHIIEAHGGRVHIESAVGRGSSFSFALKT